jgi:hypothetical protein
MGMDEESRERLMAQATLQHAREEGRRARVNLPLGAVLFAFGLAVAVFMSTLLGGLIIPAGVAVMVRAAAAIVRERRVMRELAPPTARVIK